MAEYSREELDAMCERYFKDETPNVVLYNQLRTELVRQIQHHTQEHLPDTDVLIDLKRAIQDQEFPIAMVGIMLFGDSLEQLYNALMILFQLDFEHLSRVQTTRGSN